MTAIAFENIDVVKNESNNRFELTVNGHIAFIDYKEKGDSIYLIHTEAPEALAGTGAAKALVQKTLNYIKENNYQLVPYCPYVVAYIKRNQEWLAIVHPDFISKVQV